MKKLNKNPKEGSIMKNKTLKEENKEVVKMKKQLKNTTLNTSNAIFVAFFHTHQTARRPNSNLFGTTIAHEIIPNSIFDPIELISNISLEKLLSLPKRKLANLNVTTEYNINIKDDIQLYIRSGFATKESLSNSYTQSITYGINYIDVDIDFKVNNVKHKLDKYPEHILLHISEIIAKSILDEFHDTKFYVYPTYQGYRIALFYSPTLVEYTLFENLKQYTFKQILIEIQNKLNTITDSIRKLLCIDGNLEMVVDRGNAMGVLRLPLLKYNSLLDEHRLYATYVNNGKYFIDLNKWYKETPSKKSKQTKHLIKQVFREDKMKTLERKSKLKISLYEEIDNKFKEYRDRLKDKYPELFELSKALIIFLENYKVQYYLSSTENRRMNDILPMIILSYILVGKSFKDLEDLIYSLNIKQESFKGWIKKFVNDDMAGILDESGINDNLLKQNIKLVLEWLLHIEILIPDIVIDKNLISLRADIYKALSSSFDKGSIVERFLVDKIRESYNFKSFFVTHHDLREKMEKDLTDFLNNDTENIAYVVATTGLGKTSTSLKVIKELLENDEKTVVVYVSPLKAINKQIESRFTHERFKITTYQTLIERAYQTIKNESLPILSSTHLDIVESLFKELNLNLRNMLPQNIQRQFIEYKIVFILDEVHELINLYKMELQKTNITDSYKVKAILYKDLYHYLAKESLSGKSSLVSNKDKVITLTATPPIETYISHNYKYILPQDYRTCTISFHRDFYRIDSNTSELPTYIKEIDEKQPRKILIYVNNKRIQHKVISLLKKYYKDTYTILSLNSSDPSLTTKLKEIEEDDKVIIVSTAVIRAGFDSDIDHIIFYGIPQGRDELLQVVGRNRNLKVHISFVVSGDIPGKQIPTKFFKRYLRNIIDYIDIYYNVVNKEHIPKLIDIIDNNKKFKKLISKSGGAKVYPKGNDIESIVAIFEESINPYGYYDISPIASIPITKLKKYKIDNNAHIWDLAYELIPIEIRKKYFNDADILLRDFITGDKKTKKLKKTTRFKKYYQSIKNVSYETLLDKFTLTLTLNSKPEAKQKILNKLTKQILTEIQYDPYTKLYYFTNDDGYMIIPVDYNKEVAKLAENREIIDQIGYRNISKARDRLIPEDNGKIIYKDKLISIIESNKRIYFIYKNIEILEKLFIDDNTIYEALLVIFNEMRRGCDVVSGVFMDRVEFSLSELSLKHFDSMMSHEKFYDKIVDIFKDLDMTHLLSYDSSTLLNYFYKLLPTISYNYNVFKKHKEFLKKFIYDIDAFKFNIDIFRILGKTTAFWRKVR